MNNIYIGNRYVPVFADPVEWDSLRSYEALTIVTYLGTSYTSRKAVPAGTQLSNTEYWVVTGNYNAQIGVLQNDVNDIKSDIDDIKSDVTDINSDIADINSDIANINSDIGDINTAIEKHYIAFITDSYGTVESTWMDNIGASLNLSVVKSAVASRGFIRDAGGTFINSLDNIYDANKKYDYLIVYGGVNDIGNTSASIYSAVTAFIGRAKNLFPNTQIIIAGPQSTVNTFINDGDDMAVTVDAIKKACLDNGVSYCNPALWLFENAGIYSTYYDTDNTHPTSAGFSTITSKMLSLIKGNRGAYFPHKPLVFKSSVSNTSQYIAIKDGQVKICGYFTMSVNANGTNFPFSFADNQWTVFGLPIVAHFYKYESARNVLTGYLGGGTPVYVGSGTPYDMRFYSSETYNGPIYFEMTIDFDYFKVG